MSDPWYPTQPPEGAGDRSPRRHRREPAPSHRRRRRPRARFAFGGLLLVAVIAGGMYLATGKIAPRTQEFSAAGPVGGSPATPPHTPALPAAGADTPSAQTSTLATSKAPAASARPRHVATTVPDSGAASGPAAPTASTPAATAFQPADADSPAGQVLALINQARARQGLPPYQESSKLDATAAAHDQAMAGGCGLSHQCPGEPPIGTRETNAGIDWTQAGENIGDGGPIADTSQAEAQMAVSLTQQMLDEQPPDDGHRVNLLSSGFRYVGISVYRDDQGTLWLTQDFSDAD